MRIIDAHVHLFDIQGYLENLIIAMDEAGIERCCLSGLGHLFKCVNNDGVEKAMEKFPDRIIGTFYIRPGINSKNDIIEAHEKGFKLLKVTLPKKPYDHHDYFPLWQTASELKMPILFHTGVVTLFNDEPNEQISSWYMHPMRIETIANAFPNLKMIIAHLGVHWNDDAAELIRMKKNVYADLSGAPNGWRLRADKIGMDHWLWWPGAFKKIVFGSDVMYNTIQQILTEDINRLDNFQIDQKTRDLIFYKNISKMLGGI
jgi:predicted TIM-barrel fold metal-dependent hydrolase